MYLTKPRTAIALYDGICVNRDSLSVIYEGRAVSLYPQEYRLLLLFLDNPNRVLSYDTIIESLWHEAGIPTQGTIRSHIKGLRKAFKKAGMDNIFIETVHGIGYRLKPLNQSSQQMTDRQQLHLEAFKPENWNLILSDALTGVNSYFALLTIGKHEFERAQRYHSSLSLLIIDLDQDKLINDTYGQDETDEALKFTAKTIVNCLRQVDRVGRFNSQFMVILPETSLEGASEVVQRICSAFTSQSLTIQDERLKITVSIRMATYQDGDSEALLQADRQFEDILSRAALSYYS